MGGIGAIDAAVFVGFLVAVILVALYKSRGTGDQKDSQDFFLAGRGLSWWLVGFSLIAANISTEQFVGMSGAAASHVGLAIASYEWLAAITLCVVAFGFLPYFLRAGIYTMPEFLEYRYDARARQVMASATVLIYVLLMGAVTYSGALTVQTLGASYGYSIALWKPSLVIALIANLYVVAGGLKASVWADLLQGSALILGGVVLLAVAFGKLGEAEAAAMVEDTGAVAVRTLDPQRGPLDRFMDLNANRLNVFLSYDDVVLPWTALLLGLWIPNFYYWGLNQYITQRTLGSSSLAEGQKGIVFAAYLKLVIPFVVVIPGLIAFNLFHGQMRLSARADSAAAMVKYLKANPQTALVSRRDSPNASVMDAHKGPGYLIAVYPDDQALAASASDNPLVLPILQEEYDNAEPANHQVFEAKEDRAWPSANPELAAEINAHNAQVRAAAERSGAKVRSEALVAYKYDTALGELLAMLPKNTGLLGFVVVALLGAVISSLAAMLNAASSIFTLDLIGRSVLPRASQGTLVAIGRGGVVTFAAAACLLAPLLGDPGISNSIFTVIQGGQGLISPGILSVFVFGLLVRRAPRACGIVGLLVNAACYGGLWYLSAQTSIFDAQQYAFMNNFLNWMAISFALCIVVMTVMTIVAPLPKPIRFESKTDMDLTGSRPAFVAGMIAIAITLGLYVVFSPWGVAR